MMKQDEFGTVLNGKDTYREIAYELSVFGRCFIAWTDGEGTQFDILFTVLTHLWGRPQGGVQVNDLFVSIMRKGAFGFEIKNLDTHPSYYAEKLFLGVSSTTEKIAELVNGVKKELFNKSGV